ncbi:hypothetical protein HF521_019900 [Silurus meridionalis]|uniref:Uncharacterized protein n=1 Tax=Silurus meridionalis TaxID=175797 RepID=A0A8T0BMG7_SILME|nr:hypothetical protein HF521_019900 [Silurus meridionalis]
MKNLKLHSKDAATEPSDLTYSEINIKKFKKAKGKQGKSSEEADTVYSELKQNPDKDAAAGGLNAKTLEKSTAEADTLYSELKQKTDEGNCPKPADVTYAQVMVKGKKNNAEDVPEPADAIYAQVKVKSKRNNAGP